MIWCLPGRVGDGGRYANHCMRSYFLSPTCKICDVNMNIIIFTWHLSMSTCDICNTIMFIVLTRHLNFVACQHNEIRIGQRSLLYIATSHHRGWVDGPMTRWCDDNGAMVRQ